MTRNQINSLHNLPIKDKIEVVQALWEDIANEQSLDSLSFEHKKILDKRIFNINNGVSIFKPWSEIKNKYLNTL